MTAKKTVSEDKAKTIVVVSQKQRTEYAYIVRKFGNYTDFSGEDIVSSVLRMTTGFNTIKPFYIYRVSVKDGSETLVRMAVMSKITMKHLRKWLPSFPVIRFIIQCCQAKVKTYSEVCSLQVEVFLVAL